MYEIKKLWLFKRKIKRYKNNINVLSRLSEVLDYFISWEKIPKKFFDHSLSWNLKPLRELHLYPDILLIYDIDKKYKIITLTSIWNHNNVFKI